MQQHVEVLVEGESIGALATPFTMGRDPECDVILPDSSVSRRHLKVAASAGGLFIEDLGSSNGTWLDGKRIAREVIPSGHAFIVGRVSVSLKVLDAAGHQAPAYEAPRREPGQASRHQTMAVDIPEGFFDPTQNAPAVRAFECPSCRRRLRCAAHTRRVKCRNCAAIIRFDEADRPHLEQAGDLRPAEPANRPPAGQWIAQSPPPTQPSRPPATIADLPTLKGGTFAVGTAGVGMVLAAFGVYFYPEQRGLALLAFGAILLAVGAILGSSALGRENAARATGGGDPAIRLAQLDKLRKDGLLTDDEYARRREEIIRQL